MIWYNQEANAIHLTELAPPPLPVEYKSLSWRPLYQESPSVLDSLRQEMKQLLLKALREYTERENLSKRLDNRRFLVSPHVLMLKGAWNEHSIKEIQEALDAAIPPLIYAVFLNKKSAIIGLPSSSNQKVVSESLSYLLSKWPESIMRFSYDVWKETNRVLAAASTQVFSQPPSPSFVSQPSFPPSSPPPLSQPTSPESPKSPILIQSRRGPRSPPSLTSLFPTESLRRSRSRSPSPDLLERTKPLSLSLSPTLSPPPIVLPKKSIFTPPHATLPSQSSPSQYSWLLKESPPPSVHSSLPSLPTNVPWSW